MVCILEDRIAFEYEGQGVVCLEAGSCVLQLPNIRHRELGHSEDIERKKVDFLALEIPQTAGYEKPSDSLVTSVAKIEAATNLRFFSQLSASEKQTAADRTSAKMRDYRE